MIVSMFASQNECKICFVAECQYVCAARQDPIEPPACNEIRIVL